MLSREKRLRKAGDFRTVFSGRGKLKGTSSSIQRVVSTDLITLHCGRRRIGGEQSTENSGLRFGFTISKKTAKRAHDRNRIKRRLSEIARLEVAPAYNCDENIDCVIVARPGSVTADYAALRRDFLDLCVSSGLLNSNILENHNA
jgi:ribonuclease P protein component